MASKHKNLVNKIIMQFSGKKGALFELVTGSGWVGKARRIQTRQKIDVYPGDVVLSGGKFVQFGMGKGTLDIIGYRNIEVTADMVGKTVPVFVCIDAKTGKDRLTKEQELFIKKAKANNCIAGVITEYDDQEYINSIMRCK